MRKTMLLLAIVAGLFLIGLAPRRGAAQSPSADLKITGSGYLVGPNGPGMSAVFSVAVKNKGPDSSVGVTVTGGTGPAITAAYATQGSCTFEEGDFTCNLGTIADGSTVGITVDAGLPDFGGHPNYINYCGFGGQVTSSTYDPGPGPSSVEVCLSIPPTPGCPSGSVWCQDLGECALYCP
jgi:hypothetical protein